MLIILKRVKKRVAVARKLKANWFATQTGKQWSTMDYHCLKERIKKDLTSSSYITEKR